MVQRGTNAPRGPHASASPSPIRWQLPYRYNNNCEMCILVILVISRDPANDNCPRPSSVFAQESTHIRKPISTSTLKRRHTCGDVCLEKPCGSVVDVGSLPSAGSQMFGGIV